MPKPFTQLTYQKYVEWILINNNSNAYTKRKIIAQTIWKNIWIYIFKMKHVCGLIQNSGCWFFFSFNLIQSFQVIRHRIALKQLALVFKIRFKVIFYRLKWFFFYISVLAKIDQDQLLICFWLSICNINPILSHVRYLSIVWIFFSLTINLAFI